MMTKAVLFRRTAFLTRDISGFGKDRLCQLSHKACGVTLVRAAVCAVMSSQSIQKRKMVAK